MYLTKPFNPLELLTFVRRIFQDQSNQQDAYQISDADTLDMDAMSNMESNMDDTLMSSNS